MTTPSPVYLVEEPGQGVHGIAESPEVGMAVAAEKVQDYFGRPIEWTAQGVGTDHPYWEGRYHIHAHAFGYITISRYPLRTAATLTDPVTGERPDGGIA